MENRASEEFKNGITLLGWERIFVREKKEEEKGKEKKERMEKKEKRRRPYAFLVWNTDLFSTPGVPAAEVPDFHL